MIVLITGTVVGMGAVSLLGVLLISSVLNRWNKEAGK